MGTAVRFLLLFMCLAGLQLCSCDTASQDAAALRSLLNIWQNAPPSWGRSNDPCGTPWEGVECINSRVTGLKLSTMGLKGSLSGDIGQLTKLQSLDLSSNSELGGPLTPNIGNLKMLTTLILVGCSFSGNIPPELGQLEQLSFLDLNSNKFTGKIPSSLGNLSNLYWLDLANNKLTGTLPISSGRTPGLDLLVNAKHFYFDKNQLSGQIPEQLFSSQMKLIHILFDANQLTGPIPKSLGLVKSLEVLRLDRNSLSGPVPSSINDLTSIFELNLANNKLTGAMPNLTGMNSLNYVDLSNNTFDPSDVPAWFSTIQSLTALVIESGGLSGQIPKELFSSPQLQQVKLKNNAFNGTLDLGNNFSSQLQIVDFLNNSIASYTLDSNYKNTLILVGNPVCNAQISNTTYCRLQQQALPSYTTSLAQCGSKSCPRDQSLNPQRCVCAYPYQGSMIFSAPFLRDVTNGTLFQELESSLWTNLSLNPGSVCISELFFNSDNYLQLQLQLFPSTGMYFNRSEVQRLGFSLSNQAYKPPKMFGPYYFIASTYPFPGGAGGKTSMSTGVVVGIAVGCVVLVAGLIGVGIYALRQKRRADRAIEQSRPFASWVPGKESGGAPQLKGAILFSFDELRRCTNNFSETNEIGSGGYGMVYRGMLPIGKMVAIKRSKQGSMQGGLEFKTEIELLSRVHHKNLVDLVGFCFEQGEQMLVYEFIPNGTLRENLIGRGDRQLDWKKRLKIALGSARGLTYLHELANPPIIHRDVKSTNILLDENLNAKVADFGLSKLVSDSQQGHVSTQVKGTFGYLDPEYYLTQQFSEKSDVYSFGVVMLELISAKRPIDMGRYIVHEARMAIDRYDVEYYGLKDIMDPVLRQTAKLTGFRRFVELAMQCVEESAANRPTMSDVVKEIEMILHNDGLNTGSSSEPSSATEFVDTKGTRHPYDHQLSRKDNSSNSFEYSGGYSYPARIEPK